MSMEKKQSRLLGKKPEDEKASRLLGKSLDMQRGAVEKSAGEIKELYVDMRLTQRDDPDAQWHIGDIFPDRDIAVLRRSDGAIVSKSMKKLSEELNTPGSPWSRRS